jgi:SPP1 family predicted phage head-tail adaptor
MMRPGRLNKLIVVQSREETTDEYGGPVYEWGDVSTVWARILPLSGRDLIAAQAAQNETVTRFFIRYRSDITTDMRIVYKEKNYDITGIINIEEENRELQIMAKTGVSEG